MDSRKGGGLSDQTVIFIAVLAFVGFLCWVFKSEWPLSILILWVLLS